MPDINLRVYEEAQKFCDPNFISALYAKFEKKEKSYKSWGESVHNFVSGAKRKIGIDDEFSCMMVLGGVTYELIRKNEVAKKSYEELIKMGLKIGFNASIPPAEENVVFDNRDTGELDRLTGEFTRTENGFFKPNKISRKTDERFARSIIIENFGKTAEVLTEEFKNHACQHQTT